MVEKVNYTPYNPQEFSGHLQEIRTTIDRAFVEIHTPAYNRKFRNLFGSRILQNGDKYLKEVMVDKILLTSTDRLIWDQAKYLGSNRFPEMNFMYRKTTKRYRIPENPDEFFETVKNAPSWVKHQVNIDPKQIQSAQVKIASEQAASQINLSPMWLLDQLLALYETGLNVTNPEHYKKLVKNSRSLVELKTKTTDTDLASMLVGASVLCLIRSYLHPKTVDALGQFIQATSISSHTNGKGMI